MAGCKALLIAVQAVKDIVLHTIVTIGKALPQRLEDTGQHGHIFADTVCVDGLGSCTYSDLEHAHWC